MTARHKDEMASMEQLHAAETLALGRIHSEAAMLLGMEHGEARREAQTKTDAPSLRPGHRGACPDEPLDSIPLVLVLVLVAAGCAAGCRRSRSSRSSRSSSSGLFRNDEAVEKRWSLM